MVLCSCFRPAAVRYATEPGIPNAKPALNDLDVALKVPDTPSAASPAGKIIGKGAPDQGSRDTHASVDRTDARSAKAAVPSPQSMQDGPTNIWEKLASHEIRSLSPSSEAKEMTPEPNQHAMTHQAHATSALPATGTAPDLTITGHSIKLQPATLSGYNPGSNKKPSTGNCSGRDVCSTPPSRRASLGGRKNQTASPASAMPNSVMKPTAASLARVQATVKPKSDEAVWKH